MRVEVSSWVRARLLDEDRLASVVERDTDADIWTSKRRMHAGTPAMSMSTSTRCTLMRRVRQCPRFVVASVTRSRGWRCCAAAAVSP